MPSRGLGQLHAILLPRTAQLQRKGAPLQRRFSEPLLHEEARARLHARRRAHAHAAAACAVDQLLEQRGAHALPAAAAAHGKDGNLAPVRAAASPKRRRAKGSEADQVHAMPHHDCVNTSLATPTPPAPLTPFIATCC